MPKDHPGYRAPPFGRLFREAVADSVRDYFREHPELLVPGYYAIRLGRLRPLVAARIWWCDHEPGAADNKLDQPFLAGEILGEAVDPILVWSGRDRQPLVAREDLTVDEEYRYQVALAAHQAQHEPDEPLARPRRPVDLTKSQPIPPPLPPEKSR